MGENNKSKNKVIIVSIIIVISLAIIGLGVSIYLNSKNKSKNEENSSTNEEYDIESNRNLQNEIIALNATYTDAVAWLKMPLYLRALQMKTILLKIEMAEKKNMVSFLWIIDVI